MLSSKRDVYIMERMQHIQVDVFRQKAFSTPLSEIETLQTLFVLFRFLIGVSKKSFDETRPPECVAFVS